MREDQVRRTRRAQALVVVVAVAAWTAVLLVRHSLTISDALSSILGGYVTLISLSVGTVAVYQWIFPPSTRLDTDALAVDLAETLRQQWDEEKNRRRLDSPHLLPLVWRGRSRITLPDGVLTLPDGRRTRVPVTVGGDPAPGPEAPPLPPSPDGRMDGGFATAAAGLAGYFQGVPNRRLVVLGEPGSGKSVLSILLTIGLLESPAPGSRVPVQLNVSSWDPLTEALDSWIITSIARSHYDNRRRIPTQLWDQGRLLPILDGLDEIPESARRKAVRAINTTLTSSSGPLVLTCRSVEYHDVIAGGSPELHGGSVIEIQPVRVDDLVAYLRAVSWPEGVDWTRVYDHVRDHPERPAAAALGTPLMVSLVRRNYERLGGRPEELIDERALPSRHEVEDHVLSQVVTACYAPDRLVSGLATGPDPRWRADQAQRWLTYLAKHLHAQQERDLAWWQLSDRLLSRWVTPVVGLLLGAFVLALVTLGVLGVGRITGDPATFSGALAGGACAGMVFWLLAMLVLFAVPGQEPGQLSLAMRGTLARFRTGFLTGTGLAGVPTGLVLATWAAAIGLSHDGWGFAVAHDYLQGMAAGAGVIVVIAVALGVHTWLQAPPERSAEATATTFLTRDRSSSLTGAFYAGLTAAIGLLPGVLIAIYVIEIATGRPGNPGAAPVIGQTSAGATGSDDDGWWVFIAAMLLIWVVVALLLLLVRAWPRFVVVRVHHALIGRLPLRLLKFLNDAHDRGVLRESAGRFQFAHIRLQEHLADTHPVSGRERLEREDAQRRRRQQLAVVSIAAALALATVAVLLAPKDQATVTFAPLNAEHSVSTLTYDPTDDTLLAGYTDGTVRRWRNPTGSDPEKRSIVLERMCPDSVLAAVSRPGLVAAACNHGVVRVRVRNPETSGWQSQPDLRGQNQALRVKDGVGWMAADETGRVLATLDEFGDITVWTRGQTRPRMLSVVRPPLPSDRISERQSPEVLYERTRLPGIPGRDLDLSPDGRYLAVTTAVVTASRERLQVTQEIDVLVWDLRNRIATPVHWTLPGRPEAEIGFSPANDALTICDRSGSWQLALTTQNPAAVAGLASADQLTALALMTCPASGMAPIAALAIDEEVSTWIPGTSQRQARHGHTGAIERLLFLSPSGDRRYLATSSKDRTIRIWDVTPSQS